MVRIYIPVLFFILSNLANGQTVDTMDVEMVTFIEEAPFFNGDLKEFIQEELNYPSSAKNDTIEGTIVISFKIGTSGFTTDHKVIKGIRKDLDDEALRVTKLIKFNKSALQKNNPIEVEYIVPVEFDFKRLKNKSKYKRK